MNSVIDNYIPVQAGTNVICLGDFNISLSPLDVIRGKLHTPLVRNAFNALIQGNNLIDSFRLVNPEDRIFTWSKVSPPTAKRLDYIFTSESLASFVTDSSVKSVSFTDHRLVITQLVFSAFKVGKGIFKLNTSILQDREYCDMIVKEIDGTLEEYRNVNPHLRWEMVKVNVKEMSQIYCKMKKRENIEGEAEIRRKLQILEEQVISTPNNEDLIKNIAKLKSELEIFEMSAAKGAKIRSNIQEIEEGEKNTKFFLSMEKHRSSINTIKSLTNDEGVRIRDEVEIVDEIGKKFGERYNKPSKSRDFVVRSMQNFITNVNLPSLNDEEKENLEAGLSLEEVSETLKGMKHGSAPGSDGLPVEFYKVFWRYLREPLMRCAMNTALSRMNLPRLRDLV